MDGILEMLKGEVDGVHGESERRVAAQFVLDCLDGNEQEGDDETAAFAAQMAESLAAACQSLAAKLRPASPPDRLNGLRHAAADACLDERDFDFYDFDDGWQRFGDEWSIRLTLDREEGQPPTTTTFFVIFEPGSSAIRESYVRS